MPKGIILQNILKTTAIISKRHGKEYTKEYTISQIKVNKKTNNHKEIVETLNRFLVNVGPNTVKNIPVNPKIKLSNCSYI